MHFKCSGLTRDVTGNFKLYALKQEFTTIILDGSCNIVVYLMDWEVIFLFFSKAYPLKLFHEFIVAVSR